MNRANLGIQDSVVSKPFRVNELMPKIEELMNNKYAEEDKEEFEQKGWERVNIKIYEEERVGERRVGLNNGCE